MAVQSDSRGVKQTPLYEEHRAAGARIVEFAGFLMPIQYSGIIEEHRAVRRRMGMFDLSHMGELKVTGSDRIAAVDRIVTNDVARLEVGQVRYTPMCYPDGGIVDDLLVYRFEDHLMLVVNASNIAKDLEWIASHLEGDARVENVSDETALIAVQGPVAERFLQRFAEIDLKGIRYYHFATGKVAGAEAIVSRTGYTGEDGFELYLPAGDAVPVWRALQERGESEGLALVGLGARDTLRLEAGLMLYGNDIDQTTTPLEAGLAWTVKFGESDFIGRDALERQKAEGVTRRMVALEMLDRAIPRQHYVIGRSGETIGEVTSGTFSPTLERGIGLGYVRRDQAGAGTEVDVEVRGAGHPARLVKKPLYKREGG
jgi:aminomethyltransferase